MRNGANTATCFNAPLRPGAPAQRNLPAHNRFFRESIVIMTARETDHNSDSLACVRPRARATTGAMTQSSAIFIPYLTGTSVIDRPLWDRQEKPGDYLADDDIFFG